MVSPEPGNVSGLLEKPYKVCLAHALRQKGHRVLVDDTVVVEAKTVERVSSDLSSVGAGLEHGRLHSLLPR